jgi:hypothetical protein
MDNPVEELAEILEENPVELQGEADVHTVEDSIMEDGWLRKA